MEGRNLVTYCKMSTNCLPGITLWYDAWSYALPCQSLLRLPPSDPISARTDSWRTHLSSSSSVRLAPPTISSCARAATRRRTEDINNGCRNKRRHNKPNNEQTAVKKEKALLVTPRNSKSHAALAHRSTPATYVIPEGHSRQTICGHLLGLKILLPICCMTMR